MIRKLAIVASGAASLAFFFLSSIPTLSIFHQVSLTSRTTAFFSVFDGLLRVGWFTGSTPMELICETRSTDAGSLPYIEFKPLNVGSPYAGMAFGNQQALRNAGMSKHALYWQVPHVTGAYTVNGTQLRTWIGTPIILLALWPFIAFWCGPYRRHRRRRRGLCIQCGYNLAGNTTGICPECGTTFNSKGLELTDAESPRTGDGM